MRLQITWGTGFLMLSFMIWQRRFYQCLCNQETPSILDRATYLHVNQVYQHSKCRQMVTGTVDQEWFCDGHMPVTRHFGLAPCSRPFSKTANNIAMHHIQIRFTCIIQGLCQNYFQNYCISCWNHISVKMDITVYHPIVVYYNCEKSLPSSTEISRLQSLLNYISLPSKVGFQKKKKSFTTVAPH